MPDEIRGKCAQNTNSSWKYSSSSAISKLDLLAGVGFLGNGSIASSNG
jgi:hypothetical protein